MIKYLESLPAVLLTLLIGFVTGLSVAAHNQKDHIKDFVAQCQKSQFYFADGVGIQCPAVINNRSGKVVQPEGEQT